MVAVRRSGVPPTNYAKCNQTVTIYHAEGNSYTMRIIKKAFFDFKRNQTVNKNGSFQSSSFLLVIPYTEAGEQPVFMGDKVLLGVGSAINTREQWASLIPAKVPNLCVVSYVDPKFWQGKIAHWECG